MLWSARMNLNMDILSSIDYCKLVHFLSSSFSLVVITKVVVSDCGNSHVVDRG